MLAHPIAACVRGDALRDRRAAALDPHGDAEIASIEHILPEELMHAVAAVVAEQDDRLIGPFAGQPGLAPRLDRAAAPALRPGKYPVQLRQRQPGDRVLLLDEDRQRIGGHLDLGGRVAGLEREIADLLRRERAGHRHDVRAALRQRRQPAFRRAGRGRERDFRIELLESGGGAREEVHRRRHADDRDLAQTPAAGV